MKNINRFTEPENMIEQSGSLKLKWVAVIAVIGIALLIFLSGCGPIDQTEQALTVHSIECGEDGKCTYSISNTERPYSIQFKIINVAGKYQIGDTIK